ncbi:MAG TPA: 16S rRNA (cytidine(1402)-2'-O)-methyltransferase, partial [Solirubrobacteraceae bacterium]|nr:16S rRNA (cytidine(1402)-2'-O)-methyltransferase [Solirubrobacteraceae bacterium]
MGAKSLQVGDSVQSTPHPAGAASASQTSASAAPAGGKAPGGSGGALLVCATPIGNLEDVTLRVLRALGEADILACEDTRHTRRLLQRHAIAANELVSLHEHNEGARAAELVGRMRAGATVALVSDAGTPLISDPGYELVRASVAAGIAVEALPGPSATVSALVSSGLPPQRWCFAGFLPRRPAELRGVLGGNAETLVAFESPRRLAGTLALLAELDPERPAAVCRELSKLHEEVRRGSAAELAAHYAREPPRGEVVLVVGAAPAVEVDRGQALAVLRELV